MTIFNNFKARKFIIGLFYFTLGLNMSMYHYSVKRDLQEYGMPISSMNSLLTIAHMPWQFKFIPAIFCDIVPLFGRHRKPYIVASHLLALLCIALFILQPLNQDSYITLLFFLNLFVCIADVNYDACTVEDSREESSISRGTLQTKMWAVRFTGEAIGEICGPLVWSAYTSRGVFLIMCGNTVCILFCSIFLADHRRSNILSEAYSQSGKRPDLNVKDEAGSIRLGENGDPSHNVSYKRLDIRYSLKLIAQTMMHPALRMILLYNIVTSMFPTTGLATFFYVTNELHFKPEQYSLLGLISAFSKLAGMGIYSLLRPYSIQSVYVFTSILSIIVGLTSFIVTVQFSNKMTLAEFYGFDNFWCAITDDVIGDTLDTIRYMSVIIITGIVCELAVEAGAYSSILSTLNLFNAVRRFIESAVMDALHIDNSSFRELPTMVIIGISMRIVALVLIFPLVTDRSIKEIAAEYDEVKPEQQENQTSPQQQVAMAQHQDSDNVAVL